MPSSPFDSKTIYQAIWNADQQQNGVPAILQSDADVSTSLKDNSRGYVIVNEAEDFTKDTKVLSEVLIPETKKKTYDLCENLFNNYVLKSSRSEDTETETPEETVEINTFITAIIDTEPMRIAREYLAPDQSSDEEWFTTIREMWFTTFAIPSAKNRSGFEHVFVGEDTGKLGGYHFWYKYYLDDGAGKIDGKDAMDYFGAKYGRSAAENEEGRSVPEVITLAHVWDAYGTPDDEGDDLNKRIGGFWVGCSPEGLIALGMARFKDEKSGSTRAVINNAEYELKLFSDVDRRKASNEDKVAKHINTFYPIFKGRVAGTDTGDAVVEPPKPPVDPNPEPDTGDVVVEPPKPPVDPNPEPDTGDAVVEPPKPPVDPNPEPEHQQCCNVQ
uniref:EndoU domain-containing protein n=1 Tax=Ditylum brightwellii TaxID=49249 RepID=A0A7S4USH3_9STRA